MELAGALRVSIMESLMQYWPVATVLGSALVSLGIVRASIKANTDALAKQEKRQIDHEKSDTEVHTRMIDRLARIETKLDDVRDRMRPGGGT